MAVDLNKKHFILEQETIPAEQMPPDTATLVRQPLEVYHLSHDLRGPLNSVLGFSELMLAGIEGPLTEHQEADLIAIRQSARNLLWLIDTVVDLSKLEADRLKLEFGQVDFKRVVQEVLEVDFGTIKPDDVELAADLPADLPPLWGVTDRVKQVVLSLVRFGFKMQRKGRLIIGADVKDRMAIVKMRLDHVTLSAEQVADLCELVVHIHDAGRAELGPGGLEMPLVQRLVQSQNGQVWVESKPDSGTTIYVSLPLAF
jgi:light-regulated signal transduction histidine kinase (bacteriophytochrome)